MSTQTNASLYRSSSGFSKRGCALLGIAATWVILSGSTLRSCLKPTKPSQLNALTIDLNAIPLSNDEATLKQGRKIYLQHCLQCHLPDGSGGVGANLTDNEWVLGDNLTTILSVIAAGTTNAMPGWSGMLSLEDIGAVTSYVYSINPYIELPEERLTKDE